MLVDTHAHLNFPELADTPAVLDRARQAGVETIIDIGTSLENSKLAIEQSQQWNNVLATVGIHPNDSLEVTVENVDWNRFEELAKTPKVVAIGECGLDYSRIMNYELGIRGQEIERQKRLFARQIEIAQNLKLPLSIHVRDAYSDIVEILNSLKSPSHNSLFMIPNSKPLRAVFHCFSGTPEYLRSLLLLCHPGPRPGIQDNNPIDSSLPTGKAGSKAGMTKECDFYFSFAGNVTYKNADNLRALARTVPLDRLLIETDSPFLAPVPLRGTINTPANVKIVAEKLAEIKGVSFEEIAEITTRNARQLFNF